MCACVCVCVCVCDEISGKMDKSDTYSFVVRNS